MTDARPQLSFLDQLKNSKKRHASANDISDCGNRPVIEGVSGATGMGGGGGPLSFLDAIKARRQAAEE